jgi:hypothetical protein
MMPAANHRSGCLIQSASSQARPIRYQDDQEHRIATPRPGMESQHRRFRLVSSKNVDPCAGSSSAGDAGRLGTRIPLSLRRPALRGGYFAALMLSLVMNLSLIVRMTPSGYP